jgi:hypothetical protein
MMVEPGKHKGQGLLLTGDVKESQQAVEKMQEDMDKIQGSFKRHVAKYRKALDIDQVATGEVGALSNSDVCSRCSGRQLDSDRV